ncbi:MAG: hypothetical protein LBB13_02855 [Rickettsiales bacterium]|jgi:cell shape-determining protein MreD|nr:hypothetical protein [Rickettsiales bacterium]
MDFLLNYRFVHVFKKYLAVYSVFTFATVIVRVPGILTAMAKFLPDFSVIFIFLLFFWLRKESSISSNNLFIMGLIVDTADALPIGLSSASLLLSFKILSKIQQYLIENDSVISFLRNMSMYVFLHMFLQWFLYSIYRNEFYNFGYVIGSVCKDIIYGFLLYPLCKNLKNV